MMATAGVECRKDADVIVETPLAYKSIDAVMEAQRDLVDIVHTLRQVVCVKGEGFKVSTFQGFREVGSRWFVHSTLARHYLFGGMNKRAITRDEQLAIYQKLTSIERCAEWLAAFLAWHLF